MSAAKRAARKQLLKGLHRLRGRLPAGFKFDRLAANARGDDKARFAVELGKVTQTTAPSKRRRSKKP